MDISATYAFYAITVRILTTSYQASPQPSSSSSACFLVTFGALLAGFGLFCTTGAFFIVVVEVPVELDFNAVGRLALGFANPFGSGFLRFCLLFD